MTRTPNRPAFEPDPPADGPTGRLAREMVSRVSRDLSRRSGWPQLPEGAVNRFCDSLLAIDGDAGAEHVSALQAKGVSVDALYTGWLTGAANELGRRWDDDELSFAEVSLGMTRLHRLLRELGPAFVGPGRGGSATAPLAFVVAAPGEKHIFGPVMFADQLRRMGWQVRLDVSGDLHAGVAAAAAARPLAIGVSAGSRAVVSRLAEMVAGLRAAAPAARIVLGGALATREADAAALCGADATALSAREFEAAAASPLRHARERVSP